VSILLDTNALIWALNDETELGTRAREGIDEAQRHGRLMVSAVSFWEVAMLVAKKRIILHKPAAQWRLDALSFGVEEIPLDGQLAIESVALVGLHGDPVDRFIAATAIRHQVSLLTSDSKLLSWKGPLACLDARV
jgi:PIN domain nuclease of toxin-antitoxin system